MEYTQKKNRSNTTVDFSKALDSIHNEKMEQILLAYGLSKESVIMMLYKTTKQWFVHLIVTFFDIVTEVLRGDILAL